MLRTWGSQGWPLPGRPESPGRRGNERTARADTVGCIITLDPDAIKEILADSRFLELWRRLAPTVDDGLL